TRTSCAAPALLSTWRRAKASFITNRRRRGRPRRRRKMMPRGKDLSFRARQLGGVRAPFFTLVKKMPKKRTKKRRQWILQRRRARWTAGRRVALHPEATSQIDSGSEGRTMASGPFLARSYRGSLSRAQNPVLRIEAHPRRAAVFGAGLSGGGLPGSGLRRPRLSRSRLS